MAYVELTNNDLKQEIEELKKTPFYNTTEFIITMEFERMSSNHKMDTLLKLTGKKIKEIRKKNNMVIALDKRLNLAVFLANGISATTIINYHSLIASISAQEDMMEINLSRWAHLLDLGYIPIFTPPTFITQKKYDMYRSCLEDDGIEYFGSECRNGKLILQSERQDLWCRREQIADIMNVEWDKVCPARYWVGKVVANVNY